MLDRRVDVAFWALRLSLGGTAFAAGLDKFTNLLTNWDKYLSPAIANRAPVEPRTFMRMVGIIEMTVGAAILSGRTRSAGYVASAWLAGIGVQCIIDQDWYDIAARDLNMAVAASALALLTEARQAAQRRGGERELQRAA
jgi:uncharacterized membrane protein YphA (DoxX/SURF4 family)